MGYFEFYQFVAVDRPLTSGERSELRSKSTRAQITPRSFTNTYEWGSPSFDPELLLARYFDAYLHWTYITRELMLRVPAACLDPKTLGRYSAGGFRLGRRVGKHVVICFSDEERPLDDWEDPSELLSSLLPLREELVEGDLRSFYLAWLQLLQCGQVEGGSAEPPVPPGLADLTEAQQELARFLDLDEDLLWAASEGTEPLAALTDSELRKRVEDLSSGEKNRLLVSLAKGNTPLLDARLRKRLGAAAELSDLSRARPRTASSLLERAGAARDERLRRESLRAAAAQAAADRKAEKERRRRLEELEQREPAEWRRVGALVRKRTPKDYEIAASKLGELHELAVARGRLDGFLLRLSRLRARHSRKSSFLRRLDALGLAEGGPQSDSSC